MSAWDVIVVGAGISGLSTAAALAHRGRRVLVLEQHTVAGGLTQTFRRQRWTFATGVHYLGGLADAPGEAGQFRRLLDWLTEGALRFAPSANPYDIVRLPGFEFGIPHPQAAYRAALEERFPHERQAIARWFDEMTAARRAAFAHMASLGMPAWLAWGLRWWRGAAIERYTRRTVAEALADVGDPRLRAVLAARWGDYGAAPTQAPLLEHALVTGAYDHGAWYPEGGPARLAEALVPVIERAGGAVRLDADVTRIVLEDGRARGVTCQWGGQTVTESAPHVVSTMGVQATAERLPAGAAPDWQTAARALHPGLGCIALYLGFEGDIAAAGASSANIWLYERDDVTPVWQAPAEEDAPGLFVSFPSLKDPAAGAPTGEVLALCRPEVFAPWLGPEPAPGQRPAAAARPQAYLAFKTRVEERLLAQFDRHFPALRPLRRFHELSTPLSQRHFVRTPAGSMYGLEMSAERLASPVLKTRTPVPGLLLAGQDLSGAGVQAAAMTGLMAAAAIEPALLRQLSA